MRGVFLVAAQLSKLGFIVSPTSRSAAGADLLVTDQHCSRAFTVQVKTNAKPSRYFLVGKHSRKAVSGTHIYVLVNIRDAGAIDYYVIRSKIVAQKVKRFKRPQSIWWAIDRQQIEVYRGKWAVLGR